MKQRVRESHTERWKDSDGTLHINHSVIMESCLDRIVVVSDVRKCIE